MKNTMRNNRAVRIATAAMVSTMIVGAVPALSNIMVPSAVAVTPATSLTASGIDAYQYKAVINKLESTIDWSKYANATSFLTYVGGVKVDVNYAIPVDNGKSIDRLTTYDVNADETDTYKALTEPNKYRAQAAASLLAETFIADLNNRENVDQKVLDRLKKEDIGITNNLSKDEITTAAGLLMTKALNNNFDINSTSYSANVKDAVNKLFAAAPNFTNDITQRGDLVFTNRVKSPISEDGASKVYFPTRQSETPVIGFAYWFGPSQNGEEVVIEAPSIDRITGEDDLGMYNTVIKTETVNKVFTQTYAPTVSLDLKNTNLMNNNFFKDSTKTTEKYKSLSDDKKKIAYVGGSILREAHHMAENNNELREGVQDKLNELGLKSNNSAQFAALGNLLLLEAFNGGIKASDYTTDETVLSDFETLKKAAPLVENTSIPTFEFTTRTQADANGEGYSSDAYLLHDNELIRFSNLFFPEGAGDNAGSGTDNGNSTGAGSSTSDGTSNGTGDGTGSGDDTGNGSSNGDDSDDGSGSRDRDRDRNNVSDRGNDNDGNNILSSNSDAGSGAASDDSSSGSSTWSQSQGTPVGNGSSGSAFAPLSPAQRDYSGTFSGGISSSVEGEEGVEGDSIKVDTGGNSKTNFIGKFKGIFS